MPRFYFTMAPLAPSISYINDAISEQEHQSKLERWKEMEKLAADAHPAAPAEAAAADSLRREQVSQADESANAKSVIEAEGSVRHQEVEMNIQLQALMALATAQTSPSPEPELAPIIGRPPWVPPLMTPEAVVAAPGEWRGRRKWWGQAQPA